MLVVLRVVDVDSPLGEALYQQHGLVGSLGLSVLADKNYDVLVLSYSFITP